MFSAIGNQCNGDTQPFPPVLFFGGTRQLLEKIAQHFPYFDSIEGKCCFSSREALVGPRHQVCESLGVSIALVSKLLHFLLLQGNIRKVKLPSTSIEGVSLKECKESCG
jgi:hypothetical protein